VVTFILVRWLRKAARQTDNLVLEADALHYRTDVLTNGGILIALIIMRFTGFVMLDSIVALIMAAFIAYASLPLLGKGLNMLLDRALDAELVDRVRSIAANHSPLVNGVHEVRSRRSGDLHFVEFHLVFDEHTQLGVAHRVADEIEMRIRALKPVRWSVNIHLDPVDDSFRDHKMSQRVVEASPNSP